VCLFDLGSSYWRLEGWRKDLWELSHIGIPDHDKECRDSIIFGNLIFWFLKEVRWEREEVGVAGFVIACGVAEALMKIE